MELKQIKELMAAMSRSGLTKLSIKEKEFEIELERAPLASVEESSHGMSHGMPSALLYGHQEHLTALPLPVNRSQVSLFPAENSAKESAAPQEISVKADSSKYVTSPMVGTFYSSPSPENPPFVKVGDKVEVNTVVCIVEAMKVMNEVKAGVSGTVTEILSSNGSPVEFGTKLFRLA